MYNGVRFASKKEANYAAELDLRIRAGDIVSYERQLPFPIVVNGKKVCKYIPDFVITHTNGGREVVEVKGYATPEWKLKKKLFEALYPELLLTVV